MSSEDEESVKVKQKKKVTKNEFIDDEAELSGDDEISEDELENSDDDQIDLDLVDKDAAELDSDEEEEVRGLYHKQLESEDRRAVLLLQEQLEDKDVSIGHRRRRKFRWQTRELMENSLRPHYDPDDDDSQEGCDEEDDDIINSELKPRLRRPTTEAKPTSNSNNISDLSRFVFRDKETVEALSTRETATTSREEKDKIIQREIKRVLQSRSVFDQLYS